MARALDEGFADIIALARARLTQVRSGLITTRTAQPCVSSLGKTMQPIVTIWFHIVTGVTKSTQS